MSKKETLDTTTQNKPAEKKGVKILKTIFNVIINILIVVVLIVSIVVATLALTSKANPNGLPNVFGYTLQYVQTPSMDKPSPDGYEGGVFTEKDVIIGRIYQAEDFPEFNVGDIVTYNSHQQDDEGNERLISHRIVDKKKASDGSYRYQTWGDNREVAQVPDQATEEEYLQTSDIVAVNYTEKYHGAIIKGMADFMRTLRSPGGFFGIILIPMIIFFLYAIIRVVINAMNYKKEKSDEEKETAEKEKQEAVDAAVAAALAAQNGADAKPADAPADMTPEQMEQFKQFLAFQQAQKAQQNTAETPAETPAEEASADPAEE